MNYWFGLMEWSCWPEVALGILLVAVPSIHSNNSKPLPIETSLWGVVLFAVYVAYSCCTGLWRSKFKVPTVLLLILTDACFPWAAVSLSLNAIFQPFEQRQAQSNHLHCSTMLAELSLVVIFKTSANGTLITSTVRRCKWKNTAFILPVLFFLYCTLGQTSLDWSSLCQLYFSCLLFYSFFNLQGALSALFTDDIIKDAPKPITNQYWTREKPEHSSPCNLYLQVATLL